MTRDKARFDVGQPVRLRSGGPKMIIERQMGEGFDCVWFDASGKLMRDWFHSDLLVLVDERTRVTAYPEGADSSEDPPAYAG
jgi:uncharacterized protein YodC (DUF2158 family)